MNSNIRNVVAGVGAVALAAGLATSAGAQGYPNKRITFVVGFAAGGFADSVARIIGEHVSRVLGQTVVVENQGGAASNIAARAIATSPADGYTVLVSTTSLAINASLYEKINYSLVKDLTPVAIAVRAPETFSVASGRPNTLRAFIEAAKSKRFTYGSAGVGSGSYLTWFSFFKDGAKINTAHVPFKGGAPAIQAAIGGQVDGLASTASGGTVSQLTSGKLTCLAVAAPQRYRRLPDCPTLAESGYKGFDGSSWVGFWTPAGTPADVVAKLNKAINSISDDKKAADNLTRNGDLAGLSVKDTLAFVNDEVATWAKRVKAAGAQVK
jgi:tripartite-type tricarboxylate transporter receptor subunit TctC